MQEENKRPTEASASPVFVHENWEWGRRDTWWLLAATLAALGVRLFRLDYRGMWTDEFHTLHAILLPWRELIFERMRAGHLPTYFILMKLWSQWGGAANQDAGIEQPQLVLQRSKQQQIAKPVK